MDDSIEIDSSKGHVMQVFQSQLDQVRVCLQLYLSSEGEWKTNFSGLSELSICPVCFAVVLGKTSSWFRT